MYKRIQSWWNSQGEQQVVVHPSSFVYSMVQESMVEPTMGSKAFGTERSD
jgi:hypothetical protein